MQANSGDPDQRPHSVASELGRHCLPMTLKKDARHIWIKMQLFCYLIRVSERGTCIKGHIWSPLEPKTESCFSPISPN